MNLGVAFETRPNALNLLRLVFASAVIFWHGLLLPGPRLNLVRWQWLEEVPVDAFFAISGFLIVRSWLSKPDALVFLAARAGRLLPGLWVCLAVTAFVIVPLAAGPAPIRDQFHYVLGNAGLLVTEPTLGAVNGPVWSPWNVSLWTLAWEGGCYLGVLALGSARLLTVRVVASVATVAWMWLAFLTLAGAWSLIQGSTWPSAAPRLVFMFAAGALLWMLRDRVAVSGRWAGAAFVLLAVSLLTPNYHLVGALPLAYLCLWAGVELGRVRAFRLSTDISYGVYVYGSPVTQALLVAGFGGTAVALGGTTWLIAAPMAWLSWTLVERPSMRAVRGLVHRVRPPEPPTALGWVSSTN